MGSFPLLSLTTFLPLAGALLIVVIVRGDEEIVARNARYAALWTSLGTFALSLIIWLNFDSSTAGFQMLEKREWLPGFNISYSLGVDGI